MSYIKSVAEIIWKKEKNEEERLMRLEHVNENIILNLREYDYELFKKDRNFHEHEFTSLDAIIESQAIEKEMNDVNRFNDILDNIGNMKVYEVVKQLDDINVFIIMNLINGYSVKEISVMLGISIYTIYKRLQNIRKKISE